MINIPQNMTVPLKMDEHGSIRVSNTRVTLDTVLACYRQGDTPEDIFEGFPTVPLTDIYAVISYYLAHQEEVDIYLKQRAEEADRIRAEVEANYTRKQKANLERLRRLKAERLEG